MALVDTPQTYAEVDETLSGVIKVYVDASFNYEPDHGRRSYLPFASGWSIAGAKDVLSGYGVSLFWDNPTNDSALAELRAILEFLKTTEENFPSMISKSNTFHVHCDNQVLMRELRESYKDEKMSRRNYQKYGKDFVNMIYYMTKTKFRFIWVKGHSVDPFNCFADKLANKCWREAYTPENFSGAARLKFIATRLKAADQQVKNNLDRLRFQPASKTDMKHAVPLWATYQTSRLNGVDTTGISYLNKETRDHGHIAEATNGQISKMAAQIRAMQYALFSYRMSDSFSIYRPVHIKTDMRSVAGVITSLSRGSAIQIAEGDTEAWGEMENLLTMLSGLKVRVTIVQGNQISGLKAIAYIAMDDYGRVPFDSEEHQKRINKRLSRI